MQPAEAAREVVFQRYMAYVRHATKHDRLEQYVTLWFDEKRDTSGTLEILDIGAGTGRLASAVLAAASRRGISVRMMAIEPCKSSARELRANVRDSVGDAGEAVVRETVFEDVSSELKNRFDLVLASHVSYYFANLDSFVSEAMGTARIGGEVLFVATSTSIMQNDLYRTLYRKLRGNASLQRTLDSDGFFTFGENIELALIEQNVAFTKDVLASSITFQAAEVEATLAAIRKGAAGPVLEAMAFLWRYPEAAMLTIRDDWIALLSGLSSTKSPLSLVYDDIVIRATR